MEIFLFWIGVSIVVGVAANTRGRNGFGWFLLALVISPLLAGLLLLALPRLGSAIRVDAPASPAQRVVSDDKVCPKCAETVKRAARVCRFCGHEFEPAPGRAPTAPR